MFEKLKEKRFNKKSFLIIISCFTFCVIGIGALYIKYGLKPKVEPIVIKGGDQSASNTNTISTETKSTVTNNAQLDKDLDNIDKSLNKLDTETKNADDGLNDKAGDLSEQ